MKAKYFVVCSLLLSSFLGCIGQASCTYTVPGGNWSTAANWDCDGANRLPDANLFPYDKITIDVDMVMDISIVLGGCCNPQFNDLVIENNSTLTIPVGITLSSTGGGDGSRIEIQNGSTIDSDGDVYFRSGRQSNIAAGGTLNAATVEVTGNGTVGDPTLDNSGSINSDSIAVTGSSYFFSDGDIHVTNGFNVVNSGGSTIDGTLDATDIYNSGSTGLTIDGEATATGTVYNDGSSDIDGSGNLFWATFSCSGATNVICNAGGPVACPAVPAANGINLNTCGVALLADILYFSGHYENGEANLEWVTIMEESNDYFIVLQSENMDRFEPVDQVESYFTNSNELLTYNLNVTASHRKGMYYQLQAVDLDGVVTTHQTIYVSFTGDVEAFIFPNPSDNGSFVIRSNSVFLNTKLQVVNQIGQEIVYANLEDGGDVFRFEEVLESGVYAVNLIEPKGIQTLKLVVQ